MSFPGPGPRRETSQKTLLRGGAQTNRPHLRRKQSMAVPSRAEGHDPFMVSPSALAPKELHVRLRALRRRFFCRRRLEPWAARASEWASQLHANERPGSNHGNDERSDDQKNVACWHSGKAEPRRKQRAERSGNEHRREEESDRQRQPLDSRVAGAALGNLPVHVSALRPQGYMNTRPRGLARTGLAGSTRPVPPSARRSQWGCG
jgi:hypothetical protein